MEISVSNETCIKCGKCVKICLSSIFDKDNNVVSVNNVKNCILCGHCVGVCPTGSITHSDFPEGKVHKIDRSLLPTPEQVMLLIKSRRSNRSFTQKPIPKEYLDMIVEAGYRAPTASNMQKVSFTLVTSPEMLQKVSQFTINSLTSTVKKLENPILKPFIKMIMGGQMFKYIPLFKRLKKNFEKGDDGILRGATALLLIHTPENIRFGRDDANLAYQNASLMAESLGVSQFYTGFFISTTKQTNCDKLKKELGINGQIHAGMALAMPEFLFSNYIDKRDISINEV